jgi:nucleoside-diphosphate-sugar epimerase
VKTILLTGATGLIGSHFLAAHGGEFSIHTVSRRRPSAGATRSGHTQIDLSKPWDTGVLPRQVDAVVHLAQSEHFREFPEHAVDIFAVNASATVRLLDYARRANARTFVLASSGGVYAASDSGFAEDATISARGDLGFYLGTRLSAEIVAQPYSACFNLITLRYFFVYGPGQRPDMLIPRLIDNVRHGRPITLQGNGGVRITPIHVSDAVAATRKALDLSGTHTINVGGPEVLSIAQIANIIGRCIGRTPVFSNARGGAPKDITGDLTRMREMLVAPTVRFEDGVKTMLREGSGA